MLKAPAHQKNVEKSTNIPREDPSQIGETHMTFCAGKENNNAEFGAPTLRAHYPSVIMQRVIFHHFPILQFELGTSF